MRANSGRAAFGNSGATFHKARLPAGGSATFHFAARISELRCPGYGDFVGSVFAGHQGRIKSGPQSFEIFLTFANDWDDYVAAKKAAGEAVPPRPATPCNPLRVKLD